MQIDELIQHTRRLARRKASTGVSLVHLGASPYIMASAARYHYFRNSVADLAAELGAELFELEDHRLALIAEEEATHAALVRLLEAEAEAWQGGTGPRSILDGFRLPDDHGLLRERLQTLQEAAAAEPPALRDEPEALTGPLTPARLALILDRLDGIDLEPFVRRQTVYARTAGWQPVYTEQATGLAELAAAFFPAVEMAEGEPLFAELCRHLDRLMLVALLLNRPWRRQRIGLNLGHAAWTTDEYRRLLKCLDDEERGRLTVELHWQDALQDAADGGRALALMREAGFTVAIDRIAIECLPLLNLERLEADWLKLVFDKTRLAQLARPDHLQALRRLDPDRLILTQADDKLALELGQKLGIRHYQGWLIDRLAKTAPDGPGTEAAA
jgi:EAL domain-containing protein (putative c-di-GMP-specific phosphodiesterase class I)